MKPVFGKNFVKYVLFYMILIFCFLFSFESARVKSNLKSRMNLKSRIKTREDGDVDANDVPNISVHIEDRDGDPLNFLKFTNERKDLSIRYADIEVLYNGEKQALMKLITHQNAKLAELNEIAEITFEIVNKLVKNK